MALKGQTLLVVEDDEETLNVLCRTLAAGGYDVIWARNGNDTVKLLTRYDGPLSMVIADVVLPGMPVHEVVEKINSRYPHACAIYVSAYDADTVRSHGVDPESMAFLAKPCEPSDLLRVVKESLREQDE